jgi:hypothetical protein
MSTNFCHLSLRERVERAQAFAAAAIIEGLEGHSATTAENDIDVQAAALAGCGDWLEAYDGDDLVVGDLLAAARAIGIAQGLLLRPELFTKGVRNE